MLMNMNINMKIIHATVSYLENLNKKHAIYRINVQT